MDAAMRRYFYLTQRMILQIWGLQIVTNEQVTNGLLHHLPSPWMQADEILDPSQK